MTLEEIQKAIEKGKAEFIKQPAQPEQRQPQVDDYTKFIALLNVLRRQKYHLTAAPTFTPKNFLEQIQFYDTGGVRRLYLYINGNWRYITLT
jgi:hypothetical protein